METIKQVLFTNWNFMRWFRLVISIVIMTQAIKMQSMLSGVLALFFCFRLLLIQVVADQMGIQYLLEKMIVKIFNDKFKCSNI